MNRHERHILETRMLKIDAELADIADLRVVGDAGGPAATEDDLLEQREEIVHRFGNERFEPRSEE